MKGASRRVSGLGVHMEPKVRTASSEQVIRELASRAHGVVTRAELLVAGLTPAEIRRRRQRGWLIPVHRGVYRVGHIAPSLEARYLAAVKACGDGAALSGRAAAYLWRLIKGSPPQPEVLTPKDRGVRGVRVHRARRTELADVGKRLGIPITTVPRTLVDLASSLTESALARACHEAGVLHRTTPAHVDAVLRHLPNAPGRGDPRASPSRRGAGHAQQTRVEVPETAQRSRAIAPDHEPSRRRPPRGLPLARASIDRRARQLPVPQLTVFMGQGPAPREGGPHPR